ncbi:helix-turn-helix domain-containing protein [Streptomyces griseorubiginosus]|uniref:helix-turn-helix domain-containing protein n=1 Tax=Streptomyces griseorubiginosus TaxID=67304 RepID=UPI0033DAE835
MDTQNPSAPPRPQSRTEGKNHPRVGGLVHENARHTERFTVIGNHLAQHPELSLVARGLALYIQSLPTGASVDIKTLASRFPEGRDRIAAALRELETHGYLRRTHERVAGGHIVTRTVSCNRPGHRSRAGEDQAPGPPKKRQPPRPRRLPAVPQPGYRTPALLQQAVDLLSTLRRADPRLLLSATDTEHLAPGVAAWLERDLTPTAVRDALTARLPAEPLYRPAAFLAHRLTAELPPLPPYRAPATPREVLHPIQDCTGCTLVFRGPAPGLCGECRRRSPGSRLAWT